MTFDSYTVDSDPFLIQIREELSKLEGETDNLYRTWCAAQTAPTRIRYDASWLRLDAMKARYERALKEAIGL